MRALTRAAGTLLINDETHTVSAGVGGCTKAWNLEPDIVTLGKAIAGGIPIGAYGLSAELADRIWNDPDTDLVDTGGVGGTLAGNALSLAAASATLESVLTEDAYADMITLATAYNALVEGLIRDYELPWTVAQLGRTLEYRFVNPAPRNGTESHAATDTELEDYLHLFLLNRGIYLTPFHNMALISPATTPDDVSPHLDVLEEAVRTSRLTRAVELARNLSRADHSPGARSRLRSTPRDLRDPVERVRQLERLQRVPALEVGGLVADVRDDRVALRLDRLALRTLEVRRRVVVARPGPA